MNAGIASQLKEPANQTPIANEIKQAPRMEPKYSEYFIDRIGLFFDN